MKKVWAAVLLVVLCAGLAGCADIQPPEDSLPAEDLASYYERAEYTLNGIDVSLAEDPTVCLVEFGFAVAHGLNRIYLSAHITV